MTPRPERIRATLHVRAETWRRLRYQALDERTSLQEILDRALERYVATELPKGKRPAYVAVR
jgi:hypothetical protein